MDIATKLTDLQTDLQECRRAITYRGGEISATAGFKEVAEKIVSLPASSSIGTVIDENTSALKVVPSNSTKYCYLKALGGMTYKDEENNALIDNKPTAIKVHGANLIPFPYSLGGAGFTQTKGGITFTINADRSFTVKGTAAGAPAFGLASNLNLPTDFDYYLTGNLISGTWVNGVTVYNNNYDSASNTSPVIKFRAGLKVNWISVQILNGTTVDATFKPMLSRAKAIPYTDYKSPTTIPIPESLQGTGKGVNTDYNDNVNFETGKKRIEVGTAVFNGTENWALTGSQVFYATLPVNARANSPSLCSHYAMVSSTSTSITSTSSLCGIALSGMSSARNRVYFGVYNSFTSVTDWKAYLQEQYAAGTPVTVTYVLETATETDIDTSAFDPLIEVEAGGSIEFITDSGYAPNSTVIYQTIV